MRSLNEELLSIHNQCAAQQAEIALLGGEVELQEQRYSEKKRRSFDKYHSSV